MSFTHDDFMEVATKVADLERQLAEALLLLAEAGHDVMNTRAGRNCDICHRGRALAGVNKAKGQRPSGRDTQDG